jgi:hypothetical protein
VTSLCEYLLVVRHAATKQNKITLLTWTTFCIFVK